MTPQPAKPRVLIVDDNPANRYAFQSVLEDDYTIHLANSGRRGLELAGVEEFAVILLDVRMPEMDGFETAEFLRKLDKVRFTPIIFTSAFDKTLAQLTRGYVAGATDFLFSPVEADLLKLKVATYVQIYLRSEALRLQIHQLNVTLQSLQAELSKREPAENGLKARIKELEVIISELNRQTAGSLF
jgi:response regulator RpfG family c-di-GMP phosphodiesterase